MKIGSSLEVLFKYTGIQFTVKTISGWLGIDCGCDKRRDNLDNLFRNGSK